MNQGVPSSYAYIARMVTGQLHIATSDKECIRHCRSKLAKIAKRREYRDERRAYLQACIAQHRRNINLYHYVTSGHVGSGEE